MKRNKIRYKSTPKDRPIITLTGKVYLRFRDAERIAAAQKGDLQLYPHTEKLPIEDEDDYHCLGLPGYFKADVFDGKTWQPVIMNDLFPSREHHFSKHTLPIDVFTLCEEQLSTMAGTKLVRTYREHYELASTAEN